jgi:SAM-dependent methyltransferase
MRSVDPRTADIDALSRFYLHADNGGPNLFEIWENGGARGDSVTPSTYSAEYRRWMGDLLIDVLDGNDADAVLSLGCGNAAVESDVVRKGYRVFAVDAIHEAVELARAKGVEAIQADITGWTPPHGWPVIYMDGVLGHLYRTGDGLQHVLPRLRSWLTPASAGRASLVVSNDSTKDGRPVQAAPGVPGFHWLSGDYLAAQARRAGFDEVTVHAYRYRRPRSGERVRSVVVAHTVVVG